MYFKEKLQFVKLFTHKKINKKFPFRICNNKFRFKIVEKGENGPLKNVALSTQSDDERFQVCQKEKLHLSGGKTYLKAIFIFYENITFNPGQEDIYGGDATFYHVITNMYTTNVGM